MNDKDDIRDGDLHEPLVMDHNFDELKEDKAFDLLQGREDVDRLQPNKRTPHHSLVDKKYVMTPGVQKKMIDRETILPSRQIEEKADLLLDLEGGTKETKKSCWSCFCFFGKGKKLNEFLKFGKKNEKENSVLNILECLFLEYNQGLVNLLWHKPLETCSKKVVLRDDFSHWINILLYGRLIRNYWISFNESFDDSISEIMHTSTTANYFYCQRITLFLLANYFEGIEFEEVNQRYTLLKRIEERLGKFLPLARKAFQIDKFILGLKQLEITDPVKRMRRLFKVYDPIIDSNLYNCSVFKKEREVKGTNKEINAIENNEKRFTHGLFMSNLCFLHDIISLSKKVDHSLSKKEKAEVIKGLLTDINKNLPSFVFIPSDGSKD
jgi:hypothetical protein